VKKFLLKACKPTSNADRKVKQWKEAYKRALAGTGQNFSRAPRSLFGGKGGGEPEHAASDEALKLIYAMY
jgi:hypothetical protein